MRAVPSLVRCGDASHFVESGHAQTDLADARHAQGAHTLTDGLLLQLDRGGALKHQLAQRLVEGHDLVDRDAALVAAAVAALATLALEAGRGVDLLVLGAQEAQLVLRRRDGLLAVRADLADEALGFDPDSVSQPEKSGAALDSRLAGLAPVAFDASTLEEIRDILARIDSLL